MNIPVTPDMAGTVLHRVPSSLCQRHRYHRLAMGGVVLIRERRLRLIVRRQTLKRQLVPRIFAGTATPAPTYIVHQEQKVAQAAPSKKKIHAEVWDLQDVSLYMLT